MDSLEKEWYIQVPWGRLCVVVWGDSLKPPVLLCHGQLDSAASFRPLMKHLPHNFYYIGMELPGNGRSDPFPAGMMISGYDMVYAIEAVVKHFGWSSFVYISHSASTYIGKLYDLSYPGKMSKVVELDSIAVMQSVPASQFTDWYNKHFTEYFKNYEAYNLPKEKAPSYTKAQAIAIVKKHRGLTTETAAATLERFSEPAGNGLIRFTLDQRIKLITPPAFSPAQMRSLFTGLTTPTLSIFVESTIKKKANAHNAFLLDEKCFPNNNHRLFRVKGNHDVHILHPERVAPYISQFLLHGLEGLDRKAKL